MSRKVTPAESTRSQAELARIQVLQDLFVFGYQCTLFRDDEKAEFIEEEQHLIPWMGDDTNMVDRCDTNTIHRQLF